MSVLKVNAINDASGGNAAKLYGVSMRDGGTGWVNRIINGDMRIDQRNAGASVPGPGSTYTVDRFSALTQSGSGNTFQQVSDAPAGFNNSLRITVGTGAAPTSTQQNIVWQPIEGFNVADLGLGAAGALTFTVSFWVKSSIAGTYSAWFQNGGSNRAYIATFTINSANTWEYKTITVAGDTSGTWLKTNGVGLIFGFSLGAGSTFQATAGSWASGDFKGAAGSVNLVATSGATFYITGVQLEAGSIASPFERRDYGRELMMCQRYYSTGVWACGAAYPSAVNAWARAGISFKTTMRSSPTVTSASATYQNASAIIFASVTADGASCEVSQGASAGNYGGAGTYTATIEL